MVAVLNHLQLGFDVIEAEHGLEAMQLFQQEIFRCVLVFLDLVMPYMDGYSTAQEIRQMEQQIKQPRTPIVGKGMARMAQHATQLHGFFPSSQQFARSVSWKAAHLQFPVMICVGVLRAAYTAEQRDRDLGGGETVFTACKRSGMDGYIVRGCCSFFHWSGTEKWLCS
jgi:CheY-like chemotaxis protein